MSEKYIIDKKVLIDLLADSALLAALDCGGVDSWEWYGESCNDFFERAAEDYNLDLDTYFGFAGLAEYELEHNIHSGIEELK